MSDLKSNTYHLELKLKANELFNIFIDYFMKHKLPFKNLIRDNYCLFYIKKIDDISDFLKGIKAIDSMMKLEDKRIEKDSSNYLQR
ncbi:DNA-binding protein WhiA [bacterium]|nr:DNA-binding protein WhiA [bacterium]